MKIIQNLLHNPANGQRNRQHWRIDNMLDWSKKKAQQGNLSPLTIVRWLNRQGKSVEV